MTTSTTLSKGIEPTTRAFLESVNAQKGPKIYEIPVAQGREVFAGLQKSVSVNTLPADIEDRTIQGPSGEIAISIVRPHGPKKALPTIIYSHGAGWVFGDRDVYERLLRDIASSAEAAVVFVDFTRSPEARYPVAIEQIYAATKYVAEHGKDMNLDTSRLAIAGDSVGGNMTAVLAMLCKERGGPKVGLQVLFYPVTNAAFDTPSYQQFQTDHFLTLDAMKWFWDQYLPDQDRKSVV
jgi:acetyl esterase